MRQSENGYTAAEAYLGDETQIFAEVDREDSKDSRIQKQSHASYPSASLPVMYRTDEYVRWQRQLLRWIGCPVIP
jgi:hypothetical protein